ncbi:MAG: hypothetical protein CK424_01265 [Legionella sp.]|nr:MAG: hypothetical protein CK424_01265 [Legionella sp.]
MTIYYQLEGDSKKYTCSNYIIPPDHINKISKLHFDNEIASNIRFGLGMFKNKKYSFPVLKRMEITKTDTIDFSFVKNNFSTVLPVLESVDLANKKSYARLEDIPSHTTSNETQSDNEPELTIRVFQSNTLKSVPNNNNSWRSRSYQASMSEDDTSSIDERSTIEDDSDEEYASDSEASFQVRKQSPLMPPVRSVAEPRTVSREDEPPLKHMTSRATKIAQYQSRSEQDTTRASMIPLHTRDLSMHAVLDTPRERNLEDIQTSIWSALEEYSNDTDSYAVGIEDTMVVLYHDDIPVLNVISDDTVHVSKDWKNDQSMSLENKALIVLASLGIPPCPEDIEISNEHSALGQAVREQFDALRHDNDDSHSMSI